MPVPTRVVQIKHRLMRSSARRAAPSPTAARTSGHLLRNSGIGGDAASDVISAEDECRCGFLSLGLEARRRFNNGCETCRGTGRTLCDPRFAADGGVDKSLNYACRARTAVEFAAIRSTSILPDS